MRVATWNVNSIAARLPRVLQWIANQHPDVLLLQETKCSDAAFPTTVFASIGYQAAHHGQGQWNGVAVLSRVGIGNVVRGLSLPAPQGAPEARYLAADCGGIRVASIYAPNGREVTDPQFQYKLAWFELLRQLVVEQRAVTKPALLVGGDFNVAPTDRDVFDPAAFLGATHVTPEERASLEAILQAGLVDLAAAVPDPEFTFYDYRQGFFRRGLGMRIDLLLASPGVATRVERVWVDRGERAGQRPSDHAPLVADIVEASPAPPATGQTDGDPTTCELSARTL